VTDRWRVLTALGAAVVLGCFSAWMILGIGGPHATLVVSDGVAILVSALAGAACAVAGRRAQGRLRRGWFLLGAGMVSWSIGETIWGYYEVFGGREVPFPSLADVGYLGMVPLALVGTAALVKPQRHTIRAVLDGLIISGSLLFVSWATVLGSMSEAKMQDWLEWTVSLAYPLGDIVIASVVFILLSQVELGRRTPLVLIGSGLLALAVADSGFAYLVQRGEYNSGDVIDVAWIAGFLLVVLAALWSTEREPETQAPPSDTRFQLLLPYVPLAIALVTSLVQRFVTGEISTFLYFNGMAIVLLVVVRQIVTLRDHQLLSQRLATTVDDLREREEQLHELAFHDSLTGLANRALFQDRVEQAIIREPRHLAVLYIDLDHFKPVNDRLGHAAGDTLLMTVGQRLLGCVRRQDTVARLGGDEFAVLMEEIDGEADAELLAGRIIRLLSTPLTIDGEEVAISASVGVAVHDNGSCQVGELLRAADIAMYGAKVQGKGRYVVFQPTMRTRIAGAAAL
jgi:diguanylate cyclase